MSSGQRQIKIMADKKLNELGTIESFDNAYVELSQNQYRISKTNLGKQLTNEVHTNFSIASSSPDYIFGQKSDGTNIRISKLDLAKAFIQDVSVYSPALSGKEPCNRTLYDGCFIMFHSQSDGFPRAVPYADWTNLQNSGEEADGVLIVEGGHSLVVAPHEQDCNWSSKAGTATDFVVYSPENRIALLNVWDGKERTAKICTDVSSPFYEESNNDSTKYTYAPGYCHTYTSHMTFAEGVGQKKGLKDGDYWLPCVAELMMIYTHKYRINAGMALISGAYPLSENNLYWSSTESGPRDTWCMSLGNGELTNFLCYKTRERYMARPVSAFIQNHPKN